MMAAQCTRGAASANLQGRKPREVRRSCASEAMGISALAVCCRRALTASLGSGRRGWRARSADRDRQNRRRATEIDRQDGCQGGATTSMVILSRAGEEDMKNRLVAGIL